MEPEPTHRPARDTMHASPSRAGMFDTLAARLIALDSEDTAEWEQLIVEFEGLARGESMSDSVQSLMLACASTMAAATAEGDRVAALRDVYKLLEIAMEDVSGVVFPETQTGISQPAAIEHTAAAIETLVIGASERPTDIDAELVLNFVNESREMLLEAEAALLRLEANADDVEAINRVLRAVHTIKGTSNFLPFDDISALAHNAENLLTRVRDREIRYGGRYADLCLRSIDMLRALSDGLAEFLRTVGVENGVPSGATRVLPEGFDRLIQQLQIEAGGSAVAVPAGAAISLDSLPRSMEALSVPVPRADVPEGRISLSVTSSEVLDSAPSPAAPTPSLADSALDVSSAPHHHEAESRVRVLTNRLDHLIDLVGELVIAHTMIAQDSVVLDHTHHGLQSKVSEAGKIVRELQDLSMSMRMVPLRAVFQTCARLVRDLANKMGKWVQFHTKGEDTEIDRNIVDLIRDPLVHMVRNALDHGIELPDERMSGGKDPTGQLFLSAYHAEGNVVIEVADDGRGLNPQRIVKKAIEQRLVDSDKGLSDADIRNLIFMPGFSTAAQITDVSGRGVGMDVVKRNIEAIHGRVEIQSDTDSGTRFIIRLPLTLAITDGMLIRVGEERYIIPTINIQMSFRPLAGTLSTVCGRGEMVMLRGELIPVIRLHRLFDVAGAVCEPQNGVLVVIGEGHGRSALLVDELLGQQQVVAKSLGILGNVPGLSGCAILGDGKVGLILDPPSLSALARRGESIDFDDDGMFAA